MLAEGEELCLHGRYREAAGPLAQGWHRADVRYQQDALWQAAPALRAAYRADPGHFTAVWHAETGRKVPGWLVSSLSVRRAVAPRRDPGADRGPR
jgi:hypothetical protein